MIICKHGYIKKFNYPRTLWNFHSISLQIRICMLTFFFYLILFLFLFIFLFFFHFFSHKISLLVKRAADSRGTQANVITATSSCTLCPSYATIPTSGYRWNEEIHFLTSTENLLEIFYPYRSTTRRIYIYIYIYVFFSTILCIRCRSYKPEVGRYKFDLNVSASANTSKIK